MTLNPPRSNSFRIQLAIVFGSIVVALTAVMCLVLGRMMADHSRSEAGRSLQVVASNASRVLADGLHDRLMLIRGLAGSASIWKNGLDGVEVEDILARQQTIRSDAAWVGVADVSGVVRASTGRLLLGVDVKARPWFGAGLTGPHVGDVHPAKLLAKLVPMARNGEPQRFLDFSAPILKDGKPVGVLGMHGSWDWTRSVVESLLPKDAAQTRLEVFIFDRSGALIFGPDTTAASSQSATQRLPVSAGQGPASVMAWADGQDYLTASVRTEPREPTSDLGWYVVARMPAEVAFAEARATVRSVLQVGVAAGLAAAVFAWLMAGSLSRPLSAIAQAAREVQDGKPGARIPVYRGSRELASLCDAIAAMTQRLVASNEQLDARVKERTAELERLNAELDRSARCDPLTEVLNRRGFEEQMKIAASSARRRDAPMSVIMVDADHFKRVNDRFGHDVGDLVLKALASVMKSRLRESDILGRLGGEEFCVLLPDTDLLGARRVADELVRLIASTAIPAVGSVTVSCGVAAVRTGEDVQDALKLADVALYRAKSEGRNRVAVQDVPLTPSEPPVPVVLDTNPADRVTLCV